MQGFPHSFRASMVAVFFGFFTFGTVAAAGIVEVTRGLGFELPGVMSATFLWMLCLLYVWVLVCTPLIAFAYSISLGPRGINGRTFWGRKRFMAWEDMNRISRLGLPPFQFLRFRSNAGGPPMWLPLFVGKRNKFVAQVTSMVPEGHPIRDYV